jgi:hypothetical protein
MEEYKRLQSKLNEEAYKELELFWVNNTNFTDKQADKFVSLIEEINGHSKEVKSKNSKEK